MATQTIKNYSGAKLLPVGGVKNMAAAFLNYNTLRHVTQPTESYMVGMKDLKQNYACIAPSTTYQFDKGMTAFNHQTGYAWSSVAMADLYGSVTPQTLPVALWVEIAQISTLAAGITSGYFCHVTGDNSQDHAHVLDAGELYSDWLTANADKWVVTQVMMYNNVNDGSISPLNKRAKLADVGKQNTAPAGDICMRFYASGYITYPGDYDLLVPIISTMIKSDHAQNSTIGQQAYRATICNSRNEYSGTGEQFVRYATIQTPGAQAGVNLGRYIVFDLQAHIAGLFNSLACPWSYTLLDITDGNSDTFPYYVPTGQGTDETGGGDGTGDNSSDDITESDPDISVISSFNKHYACSQATMNLLGDYLWTSTFMDNIKLLFNDPMECVVSCRMFPFAIAGGDPEYIQLGNVATTIEAAPVSTAYSCRKTIGSMDIEHYYGSALDYEPYTKMAVYLPYIGIRDVSTNDFMGRTMTIKYVVDITTGACIVELFADEQLLYSFDGKMGVEIPISSSNAAQFAAGMLMTGMSAIGALAASGGNPLAVAGTALATAKSVANNQFHVNKGGSNSPFASFYMPQKPHLIITRPMQSLPSNFGSTYGFPCNITKLLSTLSGFTQIDDVHLSGINATSDELTEIYTLLKQGVIL